MSKKINVFLDMDGVLVDFDRGVLNQFKIDTKALNQRTQDLTDTQKKQKSLMWVLIRKSPKFWIDLEKHPGAIELWEKTKKYHPIILTAAPSTFKEGSELFLGVAEHKSKWIENHFEMTDKDRFICTVSKKKPLFMKEGAINILVDDRIKNIQEWEAAGGIGIHHTNIDDTLSKLDKLFKEHDLNPTQKLGA